MTFIPSWEEFEKSAEMLYLRDPLNTRYSLKYCHSKGLFLVKITDNRKVGQCIKYLNVAYVAEKVKIYFISFSSVCVQFKTEVQQDVRKIDKFITNLMRHMASNDN